MRKLFAAFCCVTLITACQTLSDKGNENSPYYVMPPDSRAVLHRELQIPGDDVSVFIQDGRVMPFSEVRKYYPHCKFELYTRRTEARAVMPDDFRVTRTVREEAHSAGSGLLQLARLSFGIFADFDNGGPTLIAFVTRMYLRSEKQPDIFRLTCAQWGHLPDDGHVTIAEMRRALGELITLHIAAR